MLVGCAGSEGGSQKDAHVDNSVNNSDTGGDHISPSTLYVNAVMAEGAYDGSWSSSTFDSIPVSVYRDDEEIASGQTGEPLIVTTGDVEVEVGPWMQMSDPEHPYFSEEEMWTEDGLPLVVDDYFRFIHVPERATVEGSTATYNAPLVPIVGDARYDCGWNVHELEMAADDYAGHELYDAYYDNGRVNLVDGSRILPEDPTNFGNIFADGDTLHIVDYGLVLKTTNVDEEGNPINSLRNVLREGAGYTDFFFTYINVMEDQAAIVECTMRWDRWESTFPDDEAE